MIELPEIKVKNFTKNGYPHVLDHCLPQPRGDVGKVETKRGFHEEKTNLNDGDVNQPVEIFTGDVFPYGMLDKEWTYWRKCSQDNRQNNRPDEPGFIGAGKLQDPF